MFLIRTISETTTIYNVSQMCVLQTYIYTIWTLKNIQTVTNIVNNYRLMYFTYSSNALTFLSSISNFLFNTCIRSACRFCFSNNIFSLHLQLLWGTLLSISLPWLKSSSILSKIEYFSQTMFSFLHVSYVDNISSHFVLHSTTDLLFSLSKSEHNLSQIDSDSSLVLLILMYLTHKEMSLPISSSLQEFLWFASLFSASSVSIIIFS